MAHLGRDFRLNMSAYSADFEFGGNLYKTLWTKVRGPVCERRKYRADWLLTDMWPVNDSGEQIGGEVAVGSDSWTAALGLLEGSFSFELIRIGELGAFQFSDDYRTELPKHMVEDHLFRYLEQLDRKPEFHANPFWHERVMDILKMYEYFRERALRDSIFFYHWARDCDLCESEGVEVFRDWFEAAEWIRSFGESAEGPQSLHQMTYEDWRVFDAVPVRDRALEQFEEYGYGH